MNIPYYVSIVSAALSLLLSVVIAFVSNGNQGLQTELQTQQQWLQQQQEQINAGTTITQQIGPNLLQDMAVASVKNEQMKTLLAKHGYNVSYQPPASTPAPASTPSSAAPGLR